MRYYVIAGEASGDLHASNLMKGIYSEDPSAVIRFRGGELMESVFREHEGGLKDAQGKGENSLKDAQGKEGFGDTQGMDNDVTECPGGKAFDYRSGAVMGFFELAGKLRSILRNMAECRRDILRFHPDVIIPVDYPGFNLRIARWAHGKGIKVFWYIAPKVWASREWRIRSLRRYVDRLFIVFPFEKAYFDSKGLDYIYCGNPLVDAVDGSRAMSCERQTLREELLGSYGVANAGSDKDTGKIADTNDRPKVVALLAGSRLGEVRTMMPLFKEVMEILRSDPQFTDTKWIIAGAPGRREADYGEFDRSAATLVFGRTQEAVRAADAAVVNSGTASLEAALLGTPQVVAYKVPSRLTYLLAKHLFFKAKFISLGNLCLDRTVFREFFKAEGKSDGHGNVRGGEDDCTAQNVAGELRRLLLDKAYREAMLEDYSLIRSSLGGSGASQRVAQRLVAELKSNLQQDNDTHFLQEQR